MKKLAHAFAISTAVLLVWSSFSYSQEANSGNAVHAINNAHATTTTKTSPNKASSKTQIGKAAQKRNLALSRHVMTIYNRHGEESFELAALKNSATTSAPILRKRSRSNNNVRPTIRLYQCTG